MRPSEWGPGVYAATRMGASCREHGGSAFEMDVARGWDRPALPPRLLAWPGFLVLGRTSESVEDGLRVARLDRIRGIGYTESCVGGILNFF